MALYIRHPSSLDHDTGVHPENPARIPAIEEALEAEDWLGLTLEQAPVATGEQLERVHPRSHIDFIRRLSEQGGGMVDMDTIASAGSYEAALHAAGGAVFGVDRLRAGGETFAFCGTRPPGHHAETDRAMGFCLFSNVAVAAAHAIAEHGLERVMVIDWDVHHGNGTQEVFCSSPQVLFASIHQSPLYPGTGAVTETGSGAGEGYTVNLPVGPGTGGDEFLALMQTVLAPIARAYEPQLLIVSAGYDAHRDDPLAGCLVETGEFSAMAATLRDLASELDIGVLACLEGGYALDALAASVAATVAGFTGSVTAPVAPARAAAGHRQRLRERWGLE